MHKPWNPYHTKLVWNVIDSAGESVEAGKNAMIEYHMAIDDLCIKNDYPYTKEEIYVLMCDTIALITLEQGDTRSQRLIGSNAVFSSDIHGNSIISHKGQPNEIHAAYAAAEAMNINVPALWKKPNML